MSLQFVIDGYNIIKHRTFLELTVKTAKDPKEKLLDLIRINKLCGSLNNKVVVVFDGYPDASVLSQGEVSIIYSKDKSADERIRGLIERSKNPKNIVVVSDDKEIRVFSGFLGAHTLMVDEFLIAKEKITKENKELLKPELSYTQIDKINKELSQLWLNPQKKKNKPTL